MQRRVLFGHLQPDAAMLAWLVDGGNLVAGLCCQGLDQCRRQRDVRDQHRRHVGPQVVLRNEGLQHGLLQPVLGLLGALLRFQFHQLGGVIEL